MPCPSDRRSYLTTCLGLFLVCLMLSSCASARSNGRDRTASEYLHTRLQAILDRPELAQTNMGLNVVSLRSGGTLFSYQPARLFHPASNAKLFTAVAALKTLGPDYRFTTTLSIDPEFSVVNDTLYSSVYLKGAGDPLFDTEHLRSLVEQLVRFHIRTIAGDVIVDDTYFDDVPLGAGWMWDDVEYGFSAQISAMTVNGNCVTVVVTPGDTLDAPVHVRLEPPTSYMEIQVQATTASLAASDSAAADARLCIERQWQSHRNVVRITGRMPVNAREVRAVRTVENPALYAATLLRDLLAGYGVEVTGMVRRAPGPEGLLTLAVHESEPLREAITTLLLKESDNLTAELLVKTMGVHEYGPPGAMETGVRVVRRVMSEWAGLDTLRYTLVDGSGLSWYNLVTPEQVTELLRHVYNDPLLRDLIPHALPMAGVDGTLKFRMATSLAYGHLVAKTGSMSGVSCLSGFVGLDQQEPLVFSIMMNHYIGSSRMVRQAQDDIGAALAGFSRRPHLAGR